MHCSVPTSTLILNTTLEQFKLLQLRTELEEPYSSYMSVVVDVQTEIYNNSLSEETRPRLIMQVPVA